MPTSTPAHGDLVSLRRALHADPEVGLHLPRTQQRVLDALAGLPLEIRKGDALSSVVAVLRGGRPGPAVLLRGDMDALPLAERTGLDYASPHPDAMHACGHDLHTAMLVGAARELCARRGELTGDVVFMFQPGEEGCDGAGRMIDEGVLEAAGERVVAAYALHVIAGRIPHAVFTAKPGPMLAGGDIFTVKLRGVGGHGSTPHLSRDPIPAACAIVGALQTLVTHTVDPFGTAVLTVGEIHAGSAPNIIPDEAVITGTIRWFDTGTRDALRAGVERVCRATAEAHGVTAEPVIEEYVHATINDPAEAARAATVAERTFGADRYTPMERPTAAGEDFSRVLAQVPGAFVQLGAVPPGVDPEGAEENHSPHAVFDDAVLTDGAHYLAEVALDRLSG
ncbi:M20 family metallopeptidase [Streptomyces sp. NPDC002790]|uniref:M20 metallopeptidase family protein n=1 Tax=Streptomyces sp. NPDC002790 TaxID=3154431 RepID=UPI003332C418